MPDSEGSPIRPEHTHLHEILKRITTYQHSLPDGSVELEELQQQGVLSSADLEFLTAHSVTYTPHRLSDFHALDMFHLPTDDGGCLFIGPSGPPMAKRRAALHAFRPIVESFLQLPRPHDELLLHIEFTERDGMAVAPEIIFFGFQGAEWSGRLPAIRGVAAELGLHSLQDAIVQDNHLLTLAVSADAVKTAAATVALLSRGCGLAEAAEITYSAGALDEI